jgi:Flp pilus assembly protein TadG
MALPKPFLGRLARRSEGAAAVEFAIVISLLLIIVMGVVDFGHAWFMKQIITNAAREGARKGVVYVANADGSRKIPTAADIQTWVSRVWTDPGTGQSLLPADANPAVTFPNGLSGTVGAPLTVRVSCTKTWWVIDNFIPTLSNNVQLNAETTMRVE